MGSVSGVTGGERRQLLDSQLKGLAECAFQTPQCLQMPGGERSVSTLGCGDIESGDK